MIKLSVKERRDQFLFFIGIFLFTTMLLSYGLFNDHADGRVVSKAELSEKLSSNAEFEEMIAEQRATVDTTYKQIMSFDPKVQAVFLENDIKNSLSSIKSNYQRKAYDQRYKTFLQVSQLYNDLFYNRRELKGNNSDIENLNKSLEDCKLSTRQLRATMGNQSR
ncbi:type VI secretion system transmembrane protein TssO [Pedobacter sp. BAL39]|uniref:type VI secretion system transmembrane protein TssO n=1 Tax=Pedobacter sp. BAL39 TaxID=391596 RepID=UPI000587FAB8|nr:type VI secretion system transmembrane protein TssO [Pedobacter sp. BAL39]